MSLEIVAVPPPEPGAGPSEHLVSYTDLVRRGLTAVLGDDDLADSASSLAVRYGTQTLHRKQLLLALEGGDVTGGCYVMMPLRDNPTVATGYFDVDPRADPVRVVPVLWDAALEILRDAGRSTVQVWSTHAPDPSLPQLTPLTGVGQMPRDATAQAFQAVGLRLEQVERHSVLEVGPALDVAAAELPRAREAAGTAYRTLSWVGPTPPERREAMAVLMARMSTDAPSGELELEPEVWDADRVGEQDRVRVEAGQTSLTTVAQHVGTGDLVAYTVIVQPSDKPRMASQEDTLVHAGHRGHRLGMLAKTLNLRLLADRFPGVARLHTWNAGENEHMLAINVALGFRDRSVGGCWQLTGL